MQATATEGLNTPFFYPIRGRLDQVSQAAANIRLAARANLPELEVAPPHGGRSVIVGSAPTAKPYIEEIRAHQKAGASVFAVNDAHDWLLGEGVVPDGMVFMEIDAIPLSMFAKPHPDVTYYVASTCDPVIREQLLGYDVVLWHCGSSEKEQVDAWGLFPNPALILGGSNTFSRTVTLQYARGYRDFDVYGIACSHEEGGETHALHKDGRPLGEERPVRARALTTGEERVFYSRPYLMQQVDEFKRFCLYHHEKFKLRFHGEGLMPWVHKTMFPAQYEVTNG